MGSLLVFMYVALLLRSHYSLSEIITDLNLSVLYLKNVKNIAMTIVNINIFQCERCWPYIETYFLY